MKKRLLAVVLAVCMIASACVLFASAMDTKKGSYYYTTGTSVTDLSEAFSSGTIKATLKDEPSISSGAKNVTKDNVTDLFTFSPEYAKIARYISSVSGTVTPNPDGTTATITGFKITLVSGLTVYCAQDSKNVEDSKSLSQAVADNEFTAKELTDVTLSGVSGSTINNVKLTSKLYKVTTGIRISGEAYNNLVASEIAQVEMTVTRKGGAASGKVVKAVTNEVSDLMDGDEVVLVTSLKNPTDEKYYKFNCWINGAGDVVGTSNRIEYIVNKDASFYAVYVETVNRWRIDFSSSGNGKVLVFPDGTSKTTTREVFQGDKQISVLEGKDFTFTLQPDEGWQVGKVIVTDRQTGTSRNITSLVGLLTGETDWKTLIRATLTNTLGTNGTIKSESLGDPTYTFSNVDRDYSIDVTFIEQSPLVAAEGKELPTIAAEGLTLMGAEEAVSEAEAAAAARGEAGGTTVPAENGAAGGKGAAAASGSVVNPATGSTTSAVGVFAALAVAAGAAVVTMKKKED